MARDVTISEYAGQSIVLQNVDMGYYLQSAASQTTATNVQIQMGSTGTSAAQEWTMSANTDGTYSFKAYTGYYMSMRASGNSASVKSSSSLGDTEKFYITVVDETWCLQSKKYSNYLGVGKGGKNYTYGYTSCSSSLNSRWTPILVSSIIDYTKYIGLEIALQAYDSSYVGPW